MKHKLTILVVGLLLAVLAIGGIAPAVSAHGGTDTQSPDTNTAQTANVTEAYADVMAEWMTARMGPEGVEAFEQETGASIEAVTHAMAEQMGPQAGTWNDTAEQAPYSPGWTDGYQAPGGYGPQMPTGPHMAPGWGFGSAADERYGPSTGNGWGHGMFGGQGPGFFGGSGSWFWPGGSGPGGSGGHGMGGHGMGGGW